MMTTRRYFTRAMFIGLLSLGISMSGLFSCSRIFDNERDKNSEKTPYKEERRGSEGGLCYSDQTCNVGLNCHFQVCLSPLSFGDAGVVVSEDGSILELDGARPMGSQGALCYPDQTCNAGFACQSAVCVILQDGGPLADQFFDALST